MNNKIDSIKAETLAIEMMMRELSPLEPAARMRVLAYAQDWASCATTELKEDLA